MTNKDFREDFSARLHKLWSNWAESLFAATHWRDGGSVEIPNEITAVWLRRMRTPYKELTEQEKARYRQEADAFLTEMGSELRAVEGTK